MVGLAGWWVGCCIVFKTNDISFGINGWTGWLVGWLLN